MSCLAAPRARSKSRAASGELEYVGTDGRLRFATVRWAGSAGPARGVDSESSESSSDGENDCDSDAVEFDTGEHGSGAIGDCVREYLLVRCL